MKRIQHLITFLLYSTVTSELRDERGERKVRALPSRIRGLSRKLNVWGDEKHNSENVILLDLPATATARAFKARKGKGKKGKTKGNDDYSDDSDEESPGAYRETDSGGSPYDKNPVPGPAIQNSAPGFLTLPTFPEEDSALGVSLDFPPENSAPAFSLDFPPENSAPAFSPDFPHGTSAPTFFPGPGPMPSEPPVPFDPPVPSESLKPTLDYWYTRPPSASTPSPQIQPTGTSLCQVDSEGTLGTQEGDRTLVDYVYQMELFPGITRQEAVSQIEREIANGIIPMLFPNQCSPGLYRATIGIIEYLGISTSPPDVVANGFECVGAFSEPCFVVNGELTVWSVGKTEDQVQREVSADIYVYLDSGEIERTLIDVEAVTPLRDPSNSAPSGSNPTAISTQPLDMPPTESPNTIPSVSFPTMTPGSANDGQPSVAGTPATESPDSNSNGETTDSVEDENEDEDDKPWILTFPWWGWLLIALGILALVGLKFAVDRLLDQKEASSASGSNADRASLKSSSTL